MSLPIFFQENISSESSFTLTEDTSRHIIQVLRMKSGEQLQLTDGAGKIITAKIITENKKAVQITVVSSANIAPPTSKSSIAISLIKNNSRFEWFLEKATEIGVSEIIPLLCERTEKQHFRFNRMKNILISAMLQSQQVWLPALQSPTKFNDFITTDFCQNKYIAHCEKDEKQLLIDQPINQLTGKLVLIGPEGDFTKEEIGLAIKNNFIPISLGDTRLRTETAGIVAATIFSFKK